MRSYWFVWLFGFTGTVVANPYCPASVAPEPGYWTAQVGGNISPSGLGRYSKSLRELAEWVRAATEAAHPGYSLILNSPTDGSRAPICFKLFINGKLWGDNPATQRCGASFYPVANAMHPNRACPMGYALRQGRCIPLHPPSTLCPKLEKTVGTQDCYVGNPISPVNGNKIAYEVDYESPGAYPLILARSYNSQTDHWGRLGPKWRHHFDRALFQHAGRTKAVSLTRPDGRTFEFVRRGTRWQSETPSFGELRVFSDKGWEFFDRASQTMEYYDSDSKLLRLQYQGGYTQTLFYNKAGELERVEDLFGRQLVFGYDNRHRLTSVQTASGSIRYEYDTVNRLSTVVFPNETRKQYRYESTEHPHLLTGMVNENSVLAAAWDYDGDGRAILSNHAVGTDLTSVSYENSKGIRLVGDATGACAYEYVTLQGEAKLSKIGGENCHLCPQGAYWTYDATGLVTSHTDCSGLKTTYMRDRLGRELQRTEAAGTPEARLITTIWHPQFNLPLTIETPLKTLSFTYDGKPLLTERTEVKNGDTRAWKYQYNAQGLLVEEDGPREDVRDITHWAHDEQGRLLKIENALGHTVQITAHDAEGRVTSLTDENGLIRQFAYDTRGRLVSERQASRLTTFWYNPAGELIAVTHPDKTQTLYRYDGASHLVEIQIPGGAKQQFSYDPIHNLTKKQVVAADGNLAFQETWAYQNHLLPKEYQNGLGQSTAWAYDAYNRLAQTQSPLLTLTRYGYDSLNRLTQTQDALGGISQFVYDAEDQLVRYTDSTRLVTQVTYDGFNYQEQNPNTGTQNFILDKAGNIIQKTNALGQSLNFVYDAVNRLTQLTTPDEKITFAYDAGNHAKGHLTSMTYPQGEVRYTYTPEGEIQSQTDKICPEQNCLSFTQQLTYDELGRMKTLTYPSRHVLNYQRNLQGEITAITLQADKTLSIAQNIQHTPVGLKSMTLGNGLVVERKYDLAGNLVSQTTPNLTNHRYVYDAHYNLLEWFQDEQKRTYGYDLLSRLILENNTDHRYDKVGNRLDQPTGVTTNAAGQVTEKGNLQLQYDAQGRLTSLTQNNQKIADYTYNPLHLRASKRVGPNTTYFIYNQQGQLIAECGSNQTLIREYFYLGEEPVAFWEQNALYFLHLSPNQTPEIATDQNQQIVWQAHTNAFGVPLSNHTPNKIDFPLRFPGQYYDAESGLHYNWHRYYDPELGRYLQPDPIGLTGGVNLYAYANNNPLRWADPMGLDWVYSQSTGQMTHVDSDGNRTNVGVGYAGHGLGVNNPAMQNVRNVGPLPRGTYMINPQQDNGNLIGSMRLTPDPTNQMFDRSRFLIHGPHANDRQDSSNGCPVFNRNIRDQIGNSGDNVLRVVP